MKELNTKSECYYIEKIVSFNPLNLSKVHLIDDDCNEFICTVVGCPFKGYVSPSEIKVLDYEEYQDSKWNEMITYIEYERAVIL